MVVGETETQRRSGGFLCRLGNAVPSRWRRSRLAGLKSDESGVTAVEFGILALPFFLFVLGIMAVGLQFFTINALDHAVEVAARKIRTGEAQRDGKTVDDFKQLVCEAGGSYIEKDCNSEQLRVHVQSSGNWAGIDPRICAAAGQLSAEFGLGTDPLAASAGGAGAVVLVTVCYDWRLPIKFPYLQYMLMRPTDGIPLASGGSLIQSVATFRTEPYD